ncbi:SPOR domain-containing protein [Arenimonas sp.]|uniref:SPOR domain-containing protein n=1 Tax=Arenimonas sp. TaxID=1872635 RepID=UPI002E35C839|nr:SPOR domain-containing protein [Arenimonas sp.]HEX4853644.1 SPOR domain-containing protein [Arenimonas sp.]
MILRGLAVLLICLNLGVAAWWALHEPPQPLAPPARDDGVGSLVLLGEAEAPPPPDAAELGAVPVPLPAEPACLSLGPFGTPAELRAAMAALTPGVARIQFREVAATELRGYRVFLPAAGSREAALATARQLAARGVRDYYVVTAGAQENTVSLGLFRDLGNANKRREELATLGFQAVLEPRTEDAAQWWIDIASEPGFQWQPLLPRATGIEARPVACE